MSAIAYSERAAFDAKASTPRITARDCDFRVDAESDRFLQFRRADLRLIQELVSIGVNCTGFWLRIRGSHHVDTLCKQKPTDSYPWAFETD